MRAQKLIEADIKKMINAIATQRGRLAQLKAWEKAIAAKPSGCHIVFETGNLPPRPREEMLTELQELIAANQKVTADVQKALAKLRAISWLNKT